MKELIILLTSIEDSYSDFVFAMQNYAKKKPLRLEVLVNYIKNNPQANSSDVIKFVSEQPDFFEDASYAEPEEAREKIFA